ncbi:MULTISPECIES: SPOR domain-containing protein [unclassified Sphingomonas]|jgi:SPOR domain|uniref:SPOR domain-containing protein n=1 Tax=unclassified Sphingomonas TaxID=196159 RepID=UPI000E10BFF8|nr:MULTISPECIES: SPOR domain-containing protein [unclassified Sphingomonas]AXJ96040.1 SPOR domain-containing protein [Sphingomonas sp. FARSPH]
MADERDLREEDRLPWLETVEPDEERSAPVGKMIALVVVGLAILSAIVFGIYKLQTRHTGGNGELIAAQEGDYKVRPDDPGGLKVKGEGDAAVATSAGKSGSASIDLNAVPEKPVEGHRAGATAAKAKADGGRNAVAQVPASGGRLVAAPPVTAQRPANAANGGGGSLVQLGAYPSEATANAAWAGFSKRFAYLAPLGKAVQPVAIGGRTLYRLRVNAGSANQAADICGRLRVAGESCFVAG